MALVLGLALGLAAIDIRDAWAAPRERGKPPWLTLDRIEAEPSVFPGLARLRVYASAIDLQGRVVPADKWTLTVGDLKLKPDLVGSFERVDSETAIVVLVQGSLDFEVALPLIKEQLKVFLEGLPKRTQVAIASFGDGFKKVSFADGPSGAQRQLDKLVADGSGEPQLLLAVRKATDALKAIKPKTAGAVPRKLIIVIGDGRDPEPEPGAYKKRGTIADAAGIRIHAVAFRPRTGGTVLSMYGLGELSKWAHGTLRLVRTQTAQSFEPQIGSLLKEIAEQYVLTAFVPRDQLAAGRTAQLASNLGGKNVLSGKRKLAGVTCGGAACGGAVWCANGVCVGFRSDERRGVLGWVALIGGIALGALILVGGLGWWMVRRGQQQAAAAARFQQISGGEAASAAATQSPAAHIDPHRIVPQGAHGQPVAPTAPRTGGYPAAPPSGAHGAAPSGAYGAAPPSGSYGAAPPSGAYGAAPAPAGRSLLVLSGTHQGRRLPLRHGFAIGKAPGSDLDLSADGFASTQHAHILMDAGGNCTLVDRGSTNGTYINGVRLTAEQRLSHGMLIRLGSTDVRYLEQ